MANHQSLSHFSKPEGKNELSLLKRLLRFLLDKPSNPKSDHGKWEAETRGL
jgi:hypothetical protein